jgi:hypothetical protein
MEEKVIGFDLAKTAKEKGFSVGGYCEYTLHHKDYVCDDDPNHPASYKKDDVVFSDRFFHKNSVDNIDFSNENYTIFEAPTQGLLQTWFRNKYNIDVTSNVIIVECGDKKGKRYYWEIIGSDLKLVEDLTPLGYLTYEEALEVGLQEAFNLI